MIHRLLCALRALAAWIADPTGEIAEAEAFYAADTADLEAARARDHDHQMECPWGPTDCIRCARIKRAVR